MMLRRERDDEAVSAAIATVLLFAGVLTIISGMMVSIMPVIDELHGAVERRTMEGQMLDLAAETNRLGESGSVGDTATMTLQPHSGELGWSLNRGGTWYTATHQPYTEFRLDDALDLDDTIRFRHASTTVESICMTDLRASLAMPHHYRMPMIDGTISATPTSALSGALTDAELTLTQGANTVRADLADDAVWTHSISSTGEEADLESSQALQVLFWRGTGGATLVAPILSDAADDSGRAWRIPAIAGDHSLHLLSSDAMQVRWTAGAQSGTSTGGTTADIDLSLTSDTLVEVQSSAPARLVLLWGDAVDAGGAGPGAVPWMDHNGSFVGHHFLPPALDGSLLIENPTAGSGTVRIDGHYRSVGAFASIRIPWSAADAGEVVASKPMMLSWMVDDRTADADDELARGWRPGSLSLIPPADTGGSSGYTWELSAPSNGGTPTAMTAGETTFLLQGLGLHSGFDFTSATDVSSGTFLDTDDGAAVTLNSPETGHVQFVVSDDPLLDEGPVRAFAAAGDDGLASIPETGADRCVNVDQHASGWIEVLLPWRNVAALDGNGLTERWTEGLHPFGMSVEIRGDVDEDPFAKLGSGWAFHLPRMEYKFDSSVTGMEIATRGGAVMTNHPDHRATVLETPAMREGPGPRLAVSVPVMIAHEDAIGGSSTLDATLTLDAREQLVSMSAHQVRHGWDGPYGNAMAAEESAATSFSADWITFPGQIAYLNDYTGWVQLNPGMSEAVYHAGGEPVMFNLQGAQMTLLMTGGEL